MVHRKGVGVVFSQRPYARKHVYSFENSVKQTRATCYECQPRVGVVHIWFLGDAGDSVAGDEDEPRNSPGRRISVPYTSSAGDSAASSQITQVLKGWRVAFQSNVHCRALLMRFWWSDANIRFSYLIEGDMAWFGVFFVQRKETKALYSEHSNCLPWSVMMEVFTPKRATQWVKSAFATLSAVVSAIW